MSEDEDVRLNLREWTGFMTHKKVIQLVFAVLLLIGVGFTTVLTLDQKSGKAGTVPLESLLDQAAETAKVLPSPDNKYTAYIVGDKEQVLYVGLGNDFKKAQVVNTGLKDYTNLSWTPNSQYLFAGSAASSKGVILTPQDLITRFSIEGYVSGPFWEPQGDKACFTVINHIWQDDGLSEKTTDILVLNLKKKLGGVRFARGTANYFFKMDSWDKDGKINYSKVSRKDGKLLEQFSSEFAHYLFSIEIDSQEKKELAVIKDLEYLYFHSSPDRKWLSMVKLTFSGGEAEEGIPFFYNVENGKMMDLKEEYNTLGWDAKWFKDSSRIMLNEKTVYNVNTGEKRSYQLPQDVVLLGGEPSPDGSVIALFACRYVPKTGSKGEPLSLYLLNGNNKGIVKRIDTSLIPFWEGNYQSPIPIGFTWLDNQNLIVESWRQEEYSTSSLWKINIANGSVKKFSDVGQTPFASPDKQKAAVFAYEYSDKDDNPNAFLNIHSQAGTLLAALNMKENGFSSFGAEVLWDSSSNYSILTTAYGYEEGMKQKFLVYWDFKEGKVKKIKVEQSINPLYVQDGKIVCIDGSVYS